jgi:uncharacterized membrane protein YeaQ/YmgE (transglycosylase-associated protein family)
VELLGWIVIGLLAGGGARMAIGAPRRGCLPTMLLGVLGAVVGGYLYSLIDGPPVDGVLGSLLVAFAGSCLVLIVLRALSMPRRSRR